MSDKGVKKDDVGNCRYKTSMEARVVTPKTGMGIDRKNGGGYLREKKNGYGKVKRGSDDFKPLFLEAIDQPGGSNDSSHEVNKDHFVEFEDFGGEWPEEEGGDKEKNMKRFSGEIAPKGQRRSVCWSFFFGHEDSLAEMVKLAHG